mgnify:FL=1
MEERRVEYQKKRCVDGSVEIKGLSSGFGRSEGFG